MLPDSYDPETDFDKFDELVLYISYRLMTTAEFGKTKLNKVLWMCDFEHFREWGESITGVDYVHQNFGPIAGCLENRLNNMVADSKIAMAYQDRFGYVQHRPVPLVSPNLRDFSGLEISTVERILEETRPLSARELTEISHEHPGWQGTKQGETIPYESACFSVAPALDGDHSWSDAG